MRMAAILLFGFIFVAACQAQAIPGTPHPATADEVNAVAKQLFCPVCPNTPLDQCETQACADWREEIRLKLSQGWTEEQVKQYFIDRFGDRVVGAPPARGMNWLIYLIPPAAILAGAFTLYKAFRAWKQPAAQSAPTGETPAQPADEYVQRLEEELRKSQ